MEPYWLGRDEGEALWMFDVLGTIKAGADLRQVWIFNRCQTAKPLACKSRADRVAQYVGGRLPGAGLWVEVDRVRREHAPLLHRCYTKPADSRTSTSAAFKLGRSHRRLPQLDSNQQSCD
jgi:hypothetical protein